MKMINDERGRNCVQWTQDGNSFIVLSHDRIEKDLLQIYFSSPKYTSFRRKLNRWGFRSEKIEVNGKVGKQRAFFHKVSEDRVLLFCFCHDLDSFTMIDSNPCFIIHFLTLIIVLSKR